MRVTQIDHVEIEVPDRYEAARWYRVALGFEICRDYEFWAEAADGKSFSVYFADPYGNQLEVTSYDSDAIRTQLE